MKKVINFSIIIPCFNSEKHIRRCLNSILKINKFVSGKTKSLGYEIIVVDDASEDNTQEILSEYINSPLVKIYQFKKNLGPAKARNFGSKKAKGKYLVFLDIDTKTDKNFLKAIEAAFKKNSKIGAIQAKILLGNTNKIDTAGHFLTFFGFPYEIGVGENEKKHQKEKLIFGARSAAMVIKKKVFRKINGFDEDYLIYGEDTDISWRIWLAGYQIIYLPSAKVRHFSKSSLSPKTQYRIFYEGAKNQTRNIIKNSPIFLLIWMLPLHLFVWVAISLKLTFEKKTSLAIMIYKGLLWNVVNLSGTLEKRKNNSSYAKRNSLSPRMIFGETSFKKLFFKGLKWLKSI